MTNRHPDVDIDLAKHERTLQRVKRAILPNNPKPVDKINATSVKADIMKIYEQIPILNALPEIDPSSCKICTEEKIDLVFLPCGHCSCSACFSQNQKKYESVLKLKYRSKRIISNHLKEPKCMLCRTKIEKINKIYL